MARRILVLAIAIAAGAAPGCKKDDFQGGGQDSDTDFDTEGHEFAISGPCEPNTLVGGVEAASRDAGGYQYGVVSGAITDGVNWNTTALLYNEEGVCQVYEYSLWECDPACTGMQTCNDQSECVPFPVNLDWGRIALSGLVVPVNMEPNASYDYSFQDIANPPFTPGERIVMWAEGGPETQTLLLDGMGVTPLEVETKDYLMVDEQDMEVTWIPSGDAESEIYGQFMIDQHGSSKRWIYCTWPDTGSGVIPASLIHDLYLDWTSTPIPGFATAYLFRRTVDSVELPQGCAEFRVMSQVQLNLDYVPPGQGDAGVDDGGL